MELSVILGPYGGQRPPTPSGEASVIPVGTVAGALFTGAGVLGVSASIITGRFAGELEHFRPGVIIGVSLVALLIGLLTLRLGDQVPPVVIVGVLSGAVGLVALGSYFAGPEFSPFASQFFVWVAVSAPLFTHRRVVVLVLAAIGVSEAAILVMQSPSPSPVSRWLLVFGSCVVTAVTIDGVMTLLMRALSAEHDAREEADRARAEAERVGAQLAQASQHKSDFLASMSHELRTPLNAIIGFSDVLAAQHFGDLNERQLGYVSDVQEAGRHLLALINDILDLSKIESGAMELDMRVFSLADTIDSALNLIRTRASDHRIRLDVVVEHSASEAYGDERRVKQVLANLFSNATKFTPDGGSISVRAHADDGCTSVTVSDTGVGIAPSNIARIFEDFQQVGDANTAAEGTGLGLALCRRLVELHRGEIGVESAPGAGSSFTFTLPAGPRPTA